MRPIDAEDDHRDRCAEPDGGFAEERPALFIAGDYLERQLRQGKRKLFVVDPLAAQQGRQAEEREDDQAQE